MTVTPLPARSGTSTAAKRQASTLDQLEAALNSRIVERDAARTALAELTLKAGKAADQIVIEARAVETASTRVAEHADDPAAMREFQDASLRLAAATASADAFKRIVLPKAQATVADKQQAVEAARGAVRGEKRRLAVGPRIAAARQIVEAGKALLDAIERWNQAGIDALCIDSPGRTPSIEKWRAVFGVPFELQQLFREPRMAIDTRHGPFHFDHFVANEIASWGVGDPTQNDSSI